MQDAIEIEVLEENWDAVQVFLRCTQLYSTSMAGACALGLTAMEIEAACRLCTVPRSTWPEVSMDVLHMGRIAAEALNRRQAQ